MQFQLCLLLFWIGARTTQGYGSGAPEEACASLVPAHSADGGPRSTPAPFAVTPLRAGVAPGAAVAVRIESIRTGTTFKGFLLQAVDADGDDSTPLGHFVDHPEEAQPLSCRSDAEDSATHSSADEKSTLTLTWVAPADFEGRVRFRSSFVQDYATYWVRVGAAEPLHVRAEPPPPPPPPPAATVGVAATTPPTSSSTSLQGWLLWIPFFRMLCLVMRR